MKIENLDTILHSLLDKVGGEPRRNPEVADLIQRLASLYDTKDFEKND